MATLTRQKITPFLWFDDQAEEAATFYTGIFSQRKEFSHNTSVVRVARYNDAGPGPKGSVMIADFTLGGQYFTALNGGPQFKFTEAISLMISCESQEEVDYFWTALLADGGEESMCGWLKDKYGLSWQITPNVLMQLIGDNDQATAARVMEAMMKMRKIDIETLRKAAGKNAVGA